MTMDVDVRTLIFVHVLVSSALAVLMVVFWRSNRRTPGLGHWTFATALIGVGVAIGGTLRGAIPDLLSIVVGNTMGVIILAAYWNGIRQFHGRSAHWTGAALTAAGLAAFLLFYTLVVDDVVVRLIVISAVLSVGCALCVYELLRDPGQIFRMPAMLAAALFALVGLALVFRGIAAVFWPPDASLTVPHIGVTIHFLVALVGKILVVVALLMMAVQRLQWELEARNAELDAARARAEQASHAKSTFLATMSHELRTPLNAIIGFAEVQREELLGPLGDPRYVQYANDIHTSGTHLLDLITSILDISKAEAGKLVVLPVSLDPRSILDATVPLIRGAAEAKQIALSVDVSDNLGRCWADPKALKQILLNLLSNAVKFTLQDGTVSVRVSETADGGACFTVRDSGIGIAPDDLPRLMKPFEQATRGYSQQNGGTGLGLPLVDALVRLHGGTLQVKSALGAGTTMTVNLPPPPENPYLIAAE